MAATMDWSTVVASVSSSATVYFDGGDAANYCVHTAPPGTKRVTAQNCGAGLAYAAHPSISGTAAGHTTDHNSVLEPSTLGDGRPGQSVTFSLVNRHGTGGDRTFSTFGVDGAAHKWRFIFDSGFGGA